MVIARCSFVFTVAVVVSGDQSFRSQSSGCTHSFEGLHYSRQDPASSSLLKLDTNRDGRIDPQEISSYARSQNMDAAAATEEFSSIDVNGDGFLDSAELTQVLGTDSSARAKPSMESPVSQFETPSAVHTQITVDASASAALQLTRSKESERENDAALPASLDFVEKEAPMASALDAARSVTEQLALEDNEEQTARGLDQEAAQANAKSIALATKTVHEALDAGAKAAREKATAILASISKLEDQAHRAEVKSAAFLAKSSAEQQDAGSLMAIANQAFGVTSEHGCESGK